MKLVEAIQAINDMKDQKIGKIEIKKLVCENDNCLIEGLEIHLNNENQPSKAKSDKKAEPKTSAEGISILNLFGDYLKANGIVDIFNFCQFHNIRWESDLKDVSQLKDLLDNTDKFDKLIEEFDNKDKKETKAIVNPESEAIFNDMTGNGNTEVIPEKVEQPAGEKINITFQKYLAGKGIKTMTMLMDFAQSNGVSSKNEDQLRTLLNNKPELDKMIANYLQPKNVKQVA